MSEVGVRCPLCGHEGSVDLDADPVVAEALRLTPDAVAVVVCVECKVPMDRLDPLGALEREVGDAVRTLKMPSREPVTMETVARLEAAGLYELARVARRYAKDHPRHRLFGNRVRWAWAVLRPLLARRGTPTAEPSPKTEVGS